MLNNLPETTEANFGIKLKLLSLNGEITTARTTPATENPSSSSPGDRIQDQVGEHTFPLTHLQPHLKDSSA